MTNYFLHVSILLILGFVLYQVLLRKETFYALNRIILSAYLLLAFSLPLIHIPQEWSLSDMTKPTESVTENPLKTNTPIITTSDISLSDAGMDLETATPPPFATPIELETTTTTAQPTMSQRAKTSFASINWSNTLKWTYLIGLAIFLINFLVQFSILIYYRLKFPTLKDGKLTIVEMEGDKAPFSFLNMIYINPSKYDYDTYEQILAHEKIHITRWHSIDIFLSELSVIVLWFNPFAWMYRKVVEHNLEYLTDQEMLASGANAKIYQMNLLKVSVPELPLSLSTNYNQSFLKQRIQMMNAKKSSARSTWKYLFILPILGLTISLLNPTNSKAQNDQENIANTEQTETTNQTNESTETLENIGSELSEQNTETNSLASDDENSKPNAAELRTKETTSVIPELEMFEFEETENLKVFKISEGYSVISSAGRTFSIDKTNNKTKVTSTDEKLENEGDWEGKFENNMVCISLQRGSWGNNYYWSSNDCFKPSEFSPAISKDGKGEFTAKRDPGTLVLSGTFKGGKGMGEYVFTPNKGFISTASSQGYKISEEKLIHFFLSGIDDSYFSFLKSNGYTKVSEDDLLALAIHNADEAYITNINSEFKSAGYNKPTVEELVSLRIHDVDMDYVKSFGKELYEDLTVEQIISAAIHDVEPEYISEFKALGYKDLTFDNLIAAAIHDVDVEYVRELKGAGFEDLTFDNLIAAAIHDVDPEYIREFKAAGMDVTFDNMISAAIHDIDVDYITEFRAAGMTDLTFDNLIAAGIHDIDVEYLKEAKALGYDLTFDQLIASGIHDIDIEYLRAFKASGFTDLSFDNMITAAIHDIDPEFIKDFKGAGFSDMTFDNLVTASIHDIDIEFIKKFQNVGFEDLNFDNLVAASIHDIDPSYIKEVKAAGVKNLSFDNIIAFGIHDVDTDHIKGFKAMGFNLNADELIQAGIHDVSPSFIKRMQDKGHKNLDFDEYVRLKIHGFE